MDILSATVTWILDPVHWSGTDGIPNRLLEHVGLSSVSILAAVLVALPVGLAIGHSGRGVRVAVNLANVGRAVPTLAVIAIVVPITTLVDPELGFKVYPTVLAMILLAIPPVLVNAYAGVSEVDRELVEAARGMGFTERQILARIEIPVALPVILAGVRSAAVQVIATATLGAIFGFGGLGRFLKDGIDQQDVGQTWTGVVLVASLALISEGGFSLSQRRFTSPGLRPGSGATPSSRASADLGIGVPEAV